MSKLSFAAAIRAEKRTTNASKNLLHRLQAVRSVFMKNSPPKQSWPPAYRENGASRRATAGRLQEGHDGAILLFLRLGGSMRRSMCRVTFAGLLAFRGSRVQLWEERRPCA
jgi:hypothetical protein